MVEVVEVVEVEEAEEAEEFEEELKEVVEVVEAVEVLEVVEEIEDVEIEEGVKEDVEREVEDADEVQAVEVEVEGVFVVVVLPQSPGHLWGSARGSPGIDWFPQILRNGHRCLRMRSEAHTKCLWIVPECVFSGEFQRSTIFGGFRRSHSQLND